jgi:N-acetylneuraminic acid mutarotase
VPPMPAARWDFAAASADGRIYAIGGVEGQTEVSSVEAYTLSTRSWTAVAPLPMTWSGMAATTGHDGRIYVLGGGGGDPTARVVAYTPTTNRWETLAPLPSPRYGLAAATGADGRIYAIGGYGGNSSGVTTVEAYTPSTNRWATVASMPVARGDLAAVTGPDGRVYAIGGNSFGNGSVETAGLDTVEAYTPATNSWATVPPMPPIGRWGLAAATGPDGRIYAIGGYAGTNFNSLPYTEAYTPATNSWTTVADMTMYRGNFGAATGPDGRIYALGGVNGGLGDTASMEAYDTSLITPTPSPTISPKPRSIPASSRPSAAGQTLPVAAIVLLVVAGGGLALSALYLVRRKRSRAVVARARPPPSSGPTLTDEGVPNSSNEPPGAALAPREESEVVVHSDAPSSSLSAVVEDRVVSEPSYPMRTSTLVPHKDAVMPTELDALSTPEPEVAETPVVSAPLESSAIRAFAPDEKADEATTERRSARVFMSYRREDSSGYAGRLFDALVGRFGDGSVFMDIDTIAPGQDFVQVIQEALVDCEIVLVIIGRNWLEARDRRKRRRLDNPDDFVRMEIEGALSRALHVLPVLVGGAEMPSGRELPVSLAPLARRHAFEVSDRRWHYDVQALLAALVVQSKALTHPLEAIMPTETRPDV